MTVPHQGHHETRDRNENPLIAFRNKPFTRLTIFFLTWNFALGIAGPFYSVYMLNYLKISYTYVAIFNSIFMIVMVLGYKIMGGLVDRYGSRALLNILVPPTMITPVLWTFSSPDMFSTSRSSSRAGRAPRTPPLRARWRAAWIPTSWKRWRPRRRPPKRPARGRDPPRAGPAADASSPRTQSFGGGLGFIRPIYHTYGCKR